MMKSSLKRKADAHSGKQEHAAKRTQKQAISVEQVQKAFRDGLFAEEVLETYRSQYSTSTPYRHCVISSLMNDGLLRRVRKEIEENIAFTEKETDIYKIWQSGDLANLDGLDRESVDKLQSLRELRDALYSQTFRDYVSAVTGCGPLSSRTKDLAINQYTPGGYLLCHDDVIGTRRVSFILYLVDPDRPWKAEWGGALRLYPTRELGCKDGTTIRAPCPDHVKSIPPSWNQLSFFAVQPSESFHDVEEVYWPRTESEQREDDGGRVRMAISGWFHIPQEGEEGYVAGAAQVLEQNSGRSQLRGVPDQHDMPQPLVLPMQAMESMEFDEKDLEFLIQYISPQYLTPDAAAAVQSLFSETSCIALTDFLQPRFAISLREYVEQLEKETLPETSEEIEKGPWKVARPPHKHRFLYTRSKGISHVEKTLSKSPLKDLLDDFFPSSQFAKWIYAITSTTILTHDIYARRFRKGKDYSLASGHEGEALLEVNFGITPSSGWKDDELESEPEDVAEDEEEDGHVNGAGLERNEKPSNGNKIPEESKQTEAEGKAAPQNGDSNTTGAYGVSFQSTREDSDVGGHEIYMVTDDDGDANAAVYDTSNDDDNIIFSQAPAFNRLTVVLRDAGNLKLVKYISEAAQGDRWDIAATYTIQQDLEKDDEEDEGESKKDSVVE